MANNKHREYIVVAEVERSGFIGGYCKKYWSAVELANELLLIGELFPWTESEKIKAQLRSRHLREYQIKGNQLYFDKGIYGSAFAVLRKFVIFIASGHMGQDVVSKSPPAANTNVSAHALRVTRQMTKQDEKEK